jgi:hypothetical protein
MDEVVELPAVDPRYCVQLRGTWRRATNLAAPKRQRGRSTEEAPQVLRHRASGQLALPAYRKGWHWVLVSREDAWAAGYAWFISKEGYVVRNLTVAGEKHGEPCQLKRQRYLHREVLARVLEPPGVEAPSEPGPYLWQSSDVDHRNRRRLDNTRSNLRLLSQSDQNRNQGAERPRAGGRHLEPQQGPLARADPARGPGAARRILPFGEAGSDGKTAALGYPGHTPGPRPRPCPLRRLLIPTR